MNPSFTCFFFRRRMYDSLLQPQDFSLNANSQLTLRRMFKKARLLTRPTLAATTPTRPESAKTASSPKDAPCPRQGRSELSLYKGWVR